MKMESKIFLFIKFKLKMELDETRAKRMKEEKKMLKREELSHFDFFL